jgi:hypothetical protein
VLSVVRLSAWDLAQRRMLLTLNPWARHALVGNPIGVDCCWLEGEHLCVNQGRSVAEILRLSGDRPAQPLAEFGAEALA